MNRQSMDQQAILHAAQVLLNGDLVAFPTETVYGLGADAQNPQAVEKIYHAKGRPAHHPVIVHVTPDADLTQWARDLPDQARQLVDAFWPGPLTLILPRAAHVHAQISGGQDSIGLRSPAHPVAQALIQALSALKSHHAAGAAGIAAPSANLFGHVSPTLSEHVRAEFPDYVARGMPVLEGGASKVGIESTIVDLTRVKQGKGIYLLRPGAISAQQIEQVLGEPVGNVDDHAPRVSGSLKAHYAPRTPITLVSEQALASMCCAWMAQHPDQRAVVVSHLDMSAQITALLNTHWADDKQLALAMPKDAAGYAHALYATLRQADELNAKRIFWVRPPHGIAWDGINDRLARAAAAFD